jgi:hypothetical protein
MRLPDFSGYTELPFPDRPEIVYVLCYRRPDAREFIPFYVGETERNVGRFGDYLSAKFTAPTDFKVGKCVSKLRELGCSVLIRYCPSATRGEDQSSLIQQMRAAKVPLLNDLPGYNYRTAVEEEELKRVTEFAIMLATAPTLSYDDRSA